MTRDRTTLLLLLAGAAAFVCSGCGPTPHPTPLTELNPQQRNGHGIYQAQCAVCHYDRQTGLLHGPSLSSLYKKAALPSGAAATDERVSATILHGRNQMPAMGNKVDDADLADLLAYLHTL